MSLSDIVLPAGQSGLGQGATGKDGNDASLQVSIIPRNLTLTWPIKTDASHKKGKQADLGQAYSDYNYVVPQYFTQRSISLQSQELLWLRMQPAWSESSEVTAAFLTSTIASEMW
jgi:hypothetical protein